MGGRLGTSVPSSELCDRESEASGAPAVRALLHPFSLLRPQTCPDVKNWKLPVSVIKGVGTGTMGPHPVGSVQLVKMPYVP